VRPLGGMASSRAARAASQNRKSTGRPAQQARPASETGFRTRSPHRRPPATPARRPGSQYPQAGIATVLFFKVLHVSTSVLARAQPDWMVAIRWRCGFVNCKVFARSRPSRGTPGRPAPHGTLGSARDRGPAAGPAVIHHALLPFQQAVSVLHLSAPATNDFLTTNREQQSSDQCPLSATIELHRRNGEPRDGALDTEER